MAKVIMIMGLPGSGKTTLAAALKNKLNAIHVNADWARSTITSHLGFKEADRVKQAKTLGQLSRMLLEQGKWVIVDFVNPISSTRATFLDQFKDRQDVFVVWMDTIKEGRFEDTNKLYQRPSTDTCDISITHYIDGDIEFDEVATRIHALVTEGHKSYYLRYNTHCDGTKDQWRVIDAKTMEETLVDDFELRGHLTPGMTIEHGVTKFNVQCTGYSSFDGKKFKLWY